MTFAQVPGWVKGAVPAFAVALILCQLVGRPKNPRNYQADTLAQTREAYQADTLRLIAFNDSLRAYADSQRQAKEVERAKWIDAERRVAAARVTASGASAILARAKTVRDSLDAAMQLIGAQEQVITTQGEALTSAREAFGRLTAEHRTTLERADSLDAGWRRTRERLGLAEAALAIELKRTTCTVNLVVTHVKCPSRGAVAAVGVVVGAVGVVLLRPKA